MTTLDAFDPAQLLDLLRRDPAAARESLRAAVMARASADPRLAPFVSLLAPEPEVAERDRDNRPGRDERIRQRIIEMNEDLEELHARNDALARALGACSTCWGRTSHCAQCKGRGVPGWRVPEAALFNEMVVPAIARLQRGSDEQTTGVPPRSSEGEK